MKYNLDDENEILNAKHKLAWFIASGKEIEMKEVGKTRTTRQNSAIHVYFELLARALSEAGLDMRKTLKPGVEIPWSGNTVKDYLFRPIMKAQTGKDSTTELTTKEIDAVYDTLNRLLGEKFGVTVGFPSNE